MNIAPFQSVQELTNQLEICNFSWLHFSKEEQEAYAKKVEAFFLSQLHLIPAAVFTTTPFKDLDESLQF